MQVTVSPDTESRAVVRPTSGVYGRYLIETGRRTTIASAAAEAEQAAYRGTARPLPLRRPDLPFVDGIAIGQYGTINGRSYNPFAALYWLVSGRTCGGLSLYLERNRLRREEALHLYTVGSAGFSGEAASKGRLAAGQLADLAVLPADHFSIPEIEIKALEFVLTPAARLSTPPRNSGPSSRRPCRC